MHGRIICFPEDGDYYLPNELSAVSEIFKENTGIVFYRHDTLKSIDISPFMNLKFESHPKRIKLKNTGKDIDTLFGVSTIDGNLSSRL